MFKRRRRRKDKRRAACLAAQDHRQNFELREFGVCPVREALEELGEDVGRRSVPDIHDWDGDAQCRVANRMADSLSRPRGIGNEIWLTIVNGQRGKLLGGGDVASRCAAQSCRIDRQGQGREARAGYRDGISFPERRSGRNHARSRSRMPLGIGTQLSLGGPYDNGDIRSILATLRRHFRRDAGATRCGQSRIAQVVDRPHPRCPASDVRIDRDHDGLPPPPGRGSARSLVGPLSR